MKISLIAAVDVNMGIGKGNAMPWHLPRDFKHFRDTTMGKVVLMGRNTALSMGRALPGRENWVLTSSGAPYEGQKTFGSISKVLAAAEGQDLEEICVIGGGQVYQQLMDHATDLYITHVHADVPADTFFPPIYPQLWEAHPMFFHPSDPKHKHSFEVIHYTRK